MVGNAKLEFLMAKKEEAKRRNEELKETLKRLKVSYTTILKHLKSIWPIFLHLETQAEGRRAQTSRGKEKIWWAYQETQGNVKGNFSNIVTSQVINY